MERVQTETASSSGFNFVGLLQRTQKRYVLVLKWTQNMNICKVTYS